MNEIATHDAPADANFLVRVDLADHGMVGRGEQLWAKQIGPTRFILRSLPFFSYGLRPGDEVETDENFVVQRVVHPSGRQLLRVAIAREFAEEIHGQLHRLLAELRLDHEWHRVGYVAIELASDDVPEPLLSFLNSRDTGTLHFELA